MNPPAGLVPAASNAPVSSAGSEGNYRRPLHELIRDGHKIADALGYEISHHRMKRIIFRFRTTGNADIDFRSWFLVYADPTGEMAVRNVKKERGF